MTSPLYTSSGFHPTLGDTCSSIEPLCLGAASHSVALTDSVSVPGRITRKDNCYVSYSFRNELGNGQRRSDRGDSSGRLPPTTRLAGWPASSVPSTGTSLMMARVSRGTVEG